MNGSTIVSKHTKEVWRLVVKDSQTIVWNYCMKLLVKDSLPIITIVWNYSSYRKDSQTLYVGGEMDYLATKHVMKKRQAAKHRISRQSGLEMFGGPQFMMRVWPKPPRILRNGHWPSADVKALSVIGLCSCLGRWGGWFSENMMISLFFFNNWTTKMKCTVAKHGNMNTNNQNRWGKKTLHAH